MQKEIAEIVEKIEIRRIVMSLYEKLNDDYKTFKGRYRFSKN